jgi:hypothetical protein
MSSRSVSDIKYKLSPSARVCISDTDRLLMFYLVHIDPPLGGFGEILPRTRGGWTAN